MKKLFLITLTALLLTGCQKEYQFGSKKAEFNEESQTLIKKYNTIEFDNSYDITFTDVSNVTGEETNWTYYPIMTAQDFMIKKISAQTFMDINLAHEEYQEMHFVIGNKNDKEIYSVIDRIQRYTKDKGIVTFYIEAQEIKENANIFKWYQERFGWDEFSWEYFGYVDENGRKLSYDPDYIVSPYMITWWNGEVFGAQVVSPDLWEIDTFVEQLYAPIGQEFIDKYPLGSQEYLEMMNGWK